MMCVCRPGWDTLCVRGGPVGEKDGEEEVPGENRNERGRSKYCAPKQ